MGLAVLLHESLHATGPVAAADIRGTRSGRAFEEGFVEATSVNLLPSLVGALDVPSPLGAGLRAAVRRYRPGYRAERSWARRMSARATRRRAGSAAGRAFRAGVTDRWGSDRWTRLARATGLGEAVLRAGATEPVGAQAGTVQRTAISVPESISLTTRPAAGRIRSTSWGV